jgi:hypothetical protein
MPGSNGGFTMRRRPDRRLSSRRVVSFEALEQRKLLTLFYVTSNEYAFTEGSSIYEGTTSTGMIDAYGMIYDDGMNGNVLQSTVDIDWGDGSAHGTGQLVGQAGGFLNVGFKSDHFYEEGNYTITWTVTSPNNNTVTNTAQITVLDAPLEEGEEAPTITSVEGQSFTATVGNFTDENIYAPASDFTATIGWGDGTTTTGTVSGSGGSFTVTGTHTYTEQSEPDEPYDITVNVSDVGGNGTTLEGKAVISDAVISVATQAFTATEGTEFSGVVATVLDQNPYGQADDFEATIDWGDGTQSDGEVSLQDGSFVVTGDHTYAEDGSYAVNVTVKDDGGAVASAGSVDTVLDAPFSVYAPSPVSASVGQPITVDFNVYDSNSLGVPNDFIAHINWGGGNPNGEVVTLTDFDFSLTTEYDVAGTYTAFLTVEEDGAGGNSVTVSFEVDVS